MGMLAKHYLNIFLLLATRHITQLTSSLNTGRLTSSGFCMFLCWWRHKPGVCWESDKCWFIIGSRVKPNLWWQHIFDVPTQNSWYTEFISGCYFFFYQICLLNEAYISDFINWWWMLVVNITLQVTVCFCFSEPLKVPINAHLNKVHD